MSLQLQGSHYRTILESLPNGVYVVDPSRRILFWNDGAERITGYLRQDVIGRLCPDNLLQHCDENHNLLCGGACPLQTTIMDGKPKEVDLYLRHKDGHRVPVRVRAVPIRDADGVIVGAAESFEERHPMLEKHLHAHAQAVQEHLTGLTDVAGQSSARSYLSACLEDFAEDQTPFGILTIAIDEFEGFRKQQGAKAAERILHLVAETLSKNLPPGDIVGRWGEERFVAILVDCPSAMLARVAEGLRQLVQGAAIPWWGDRISVTISAGGTTPRLEDTVETMLERSEQALLSLFEKGGNGWEIL